MGLLPLPVVNISSRGQSIRAVQIVPKVKLGSVILLAGGNGRLDISAKGAITKLGNNQLVRTRAKYAQAGFVTLVPDLAPDLKVGTNGVVPNYRVGEPHALDIGAMVIHLRRSFKRPVIVIGTSRGSISAANVIARAPVIIEDGHRVGGQPQAIVVTSAFLISHDGDLSVKSAANDDPDKLAVPMLVVAHADDACAQTTPFDIPQFMQWYQSNGRPLSVEILSGGGPFTGDPCEALAAHGFVGLDNAVVLTIATWIMQQNLP
jgi:hypothetical protein